MNEKGAKVPNRQLEQTDHAVEDSQPMVEFQDYYHHYDSAPSSNDDNDNEIDQSYPVETTEDEQLLESFHPTADELTGEEIMEMDGELRDMGRRMMLGDKRTYEEPRMKRRALRSRNDTAISTRGWSSKGGTRRGGSKKDVCVYFN